ncbi:DUF7701 domain-containing protein [Mycolicibacillus trivialis]|uniref:DUF7701 domain-containing protein n=1 Tax=Mycolicibacillus trivialis TaxID=1798 RepID=UPI001054627A|nr:hypothetical protein [Mycolicibacillus trivialis]
MAVNYLDLLAQQIRTEVPSTKLPDDNATDLFRIYAVLALAKGDQVDPTDIHNAWVAWMLRIDPTHESLVPFNELDDTTARCDTPYVDAIRKVAAEVLK